MFRGGPPPGCETDSCTHYLAIDLDILWSTITNDLPAMLDELSDRLATAVDEWEQRVLDAPGAPSGYRLSRRSCVQLRVFRVPTSRTRRRKTAGHRPKRSEPEIDPEVLSTRQRVDLNPGDLIPATVVGAGFAFQQMRPFGVFRGSVPGAKAGEFRVHASETLGGPFVVGIPGRRQGSGRCRCSRNPWDFTS